VCGVGLEIGGVVADRQRSRHVALLSLHLSKVP
jgi:hypothetical protein